MTIRRLQRDDWSGFCAHATRGFYVDAEPLGITSLQIIDAEGVRQILTLRDPLMLPRRTAD
jgi:hypothetical protein